MRIKKLTSILLASVLTFGLVSCGNSDTSTSVGNSSSNSDKITIWAWDESFNIVAANQAKEIYKEANPDVEVEVVTMAQDDIVAKLNTSLSSGSYEGLPNVVLIEDYKIQGYLTAYPDKFADMAELADALDLGSSAFGVGVRLPSSAPFMRKWLNGRAPPCQGGRCGFESRFPLQTYTYKKL